MKSSRSPLLSSAMFLPCFSHPIDCLEHVLLVNRFYHWRDSDFPPMPAVSLITLPDTCLLCWRCICCLLCFQPRWFSFLLCTHMRNGSLCSAIVLSCCKRCIRWTYSSCLGSPYFFLQWPCFHESLSDFQEVFLFQLLTIKRLFFF